MTLLTREQKEVKIAELDELIRDCEWNINYHQQAIYKEGMKRDAYYKAQDDIMDSPNANGGCGQHLNDCIK